MKYFTEKNRGFTMVELMIVITVAAVLVALAIPSFRDLIERKATTGAAESAIAKLQLAKSEALKRSKPIVVDFNVNGTNWAIGVTDKTGCNAEDASGVNACTVEYNNSGGGADLFVMRVLGSDQKNITMSQLTGFADSAVRVGGCPAVTNDHQACFDFLRGLGRTGAYEFDSASYKMRVEITQLGHVKVCVPTGEKVIVGYPTC